MLVREAISRFLAHYGNPDMAALYGGFDSGMETQIMVSPDGGELVEGAGRTFTDSSGSRWFDIRIPKNARTSPTWEDYNLPYLLSEHCLCIGCSGWDYIKKRSMWIGFDLDAITETSHINSGLTEHDLAIARDAACGLPYVETRRSTGGNGLHLRAYLGEGIPTENHTEHKALARAVLGRMSKDAGFNFGAKVDVFGHILWIYHQKADPRFVKDPLGFQLLRNRQKDLTDIPADWRDHIDVVTHKRRMIRAAGIPDSAQGSFDQLSASNKIVQLDDEHKRLETWLMDNGHMATWDTDRHCLKTHTAALAEAHEALNLRGVFKTVASGKIKGDHNCFCWPLENGGWRIVRHGQGTMEAPTWNKGEWTSCLYNTDPSLLSAAIAYEGKEDKNGGFTFQSGKEAEAVVKALGGDLEIPSAIAMQQPSLKIHKDKKRLVLEISQPDGVGDQDGFVLKRKIFSKVIDIQCAPNQQKHKENFGGLYRHVLTPEGKSAGWVININDDWHEHPARNIICSLMARYNMSSSEAQAASGDIINEGWWRLVSLPFQPEYPGNRTWNRKAPQMRFIPAEDGEPQEHPSWDKILKHCGRGLDVAVRRDAWACKNGVYTGADYLRLWIASLFQFPQRPLPYLFFYSEQQNTGKSTFHQALSLLMTSGIVNINNAIQSDGNFNGEMVGAIVGVIEEVDLSDKASRAYNRLKPWITNEKMNIHIKGLTSYDEVNYFHGVQCSNVLKYCPIFDGDTRIVVIEVPPLESEIPWPELRAALEKEAPAFLRTIKDMVIPDPISRLNIPVIETTEKDRAKLLTRTELEQFIADNCHEVPGSYIPFKDFCVKFIASLSDSERPKWNPQRVSRNFPEKHPRGAYGHDNETVIGNLAWEQYSGPELKALELTDKKRFS